MRKNRKYSKAECLSYLEEYMCSSQNHSEFEREKGLKRTTISRWLRIFGVEDKPSPIMSKKLNQTEHRNLRIKGYLLLPEAFRSLSRLSSALSAKASTIRSYQHNQLDLIPREWDNVHTYIALYALVIVNLF